MLLICTPGTCVIAYYSVNKYCTVKLVEIKITQLNNNMRSRVRFFSYLALAESMLMTGKLPYDELVFMNVLRCCF